MDRSLSKFIQIFVEKALPLCEEEINKNSEKYELTSYIPIFKEKTYFKTEKIKLIDFLWVVTELESEFKKPDQLRASYNVALQLLTHKIKEIFQASDDKSDIRFEKIAKEKILEFLSEYISIYSTKFQKQGYNNTYYKFETFIKNNLSTIFYFCPLHNFNGDLKRIEIDQDLWIREITPKEFAVVSGLIDGTSTKPDPRLTSLRYVLVKKVNKKVNQDNLKIATDEFEKVSRALKIYQPGELQLGGIYWFNSETWRVENPKKITSENHNPSIKTYLFKKNTSLSFRRFYAKFKQIDFMQKNNLFLGTSIRRFSIAVDQRIPEDKIVDFITCLESLYATKGPDILHKMANRIALLLEKNYENRTKLLSFIKKSYDMRSKIVHGEPDPFKIGSKIYDPNEVSTDLEKIARKSIHAFMKLLNVYSSKENIHLDIDLATLDGRILKKLYTITK